MTDHFRHFRAKFQSTLSKWIETGGTGWVTNDLQVSIHSIQMDRDAFIRLAYNHNTVSIHSIQMDRDNNECVGASNLVVSIHSIQMDRDFTVKVSVCRKSVSIHSIQMDRDFCPRKTDADRSTFQSTLSKWIETFYVIYRAAGLSVSIHSIQMDRDLIFLEIRLLSKCFNPLYPNG